MTDTNRTSGVPEALSRAAPPLHRGAVERAVERDHAARMRPQNRGMGNSRFLGYSRGKDCASMLSPERPKPGDIIAVTLPGERPVNRLAKSVEAAGPKSWRVILR